MFSSPNHIHNHNHDNNVYHERLLRHPKLFASIGVVHTLLTAGIVFGWASLLPILREEGLDLTPSEFCNIFTHGAIGNYLSSLPFGLVLDKFGPKTCGIVASLLFGVGCILCSFAISQPTSLNIGFALLGFAGPGIQLPTLHLARLFAGQAREGGTGGAALFMSAQAGAFDGGTMVFALFSLIYNMFGMSCSFFFQCYALVPLGTLLTAVFVWPNDILPDPTLKPQPHKRRPSYVGAGSPYLSPATIHVQQSPLVDAPLKTVLSYKQFYCLAIWVSVHILKLNFVVASINDQLDLNMPREQANLLIHVFGAILPFGFVVLPLVAYLLSRSTLICFQVANTVGVLYGSVLTFFPNQALYQVLVVFTSVATSRQLVYSTVFHQTGELFGFCNYGVLLGLTNVVVSGMSLVQGPLVQWSEAMGKYFGANLVLLLLTLPLFGLVYGAVPPQDGNDGIDGGMMLTEESPLMTTTGGIHSSVKKQKRNRAMSDGMTWNPSL